MRSILTIIFICESIPVLVATYGEISEKMCRKYSAAVYISEQDLGLSSKSGYNNVSECGIVSVPLIIGGVDAIEKEFPHFALIGFGKDVQGISAWACGGSLISEKFVLTAAHCSRSQIHGPAQKVRIGMIDKNIESDEDDDVITEEIIKQFIKHPDYKKPSKYNDIALVELTRNIEFTPFMRPACLNVKSALDEDSAIAIGFGKTATDNEEGSEVLKKVTLDLISREECGKYFPPRPAMKIGIVSSMFCAGILKGGKDTCYGDSGGPMQVILEDPYCMYSIIGVTSFGTFCGYENSPAIYSNVSHFVPWIEEIVWQNSYYN